MTKEIDQKDFADAGRPGGETPSIEGVSVEESAGRVKRYEIARLAPPSAKSVHLAIRIEPADGAALLHIRDGEEPIRCAGPLWRGTIQNTGGSFYLERQGSAARVSVICRGWEDD